MRKFYIIFSIFSLCFSHYIHAAPLGDIDSNNTQCGMIADACKNAGFTSEETDVKSFWFGCMKPVLYGKSVNGVTIDEKIVKECRNHKIKKMKKELKELESVK